LLETGTPLTEVLAFTAKGLSFAQQSKHHAVFQLIRLEQQFIRNLRGQTQGRDSFDDASFSEAAAEEEIARARFGCGLVYHRIMRLVAGYLHGDFPGAWAQALEAEKELSSAFSMPIEVS